jgi:hypothetical protein
MDFSEENIVSLFGHEAAEDEDIDILRRYYLKARVYSQIVNDLPIRILAGHKGIGKSALFQVAIAEGEEKGNLSILIRPDDIIGIADNETNFLKLIREWKKGITSIIASKALASLGINRKGVLKGLSNYGGKFVDFLQATLKADAHADLSEARRLIINEFLSEGRINIYLDDLDRGWQGTTHDVKKLSALLNAVRDLASDSRGASFRISLRSDVYFLVRTSDESTDKIEGSVIWYSWSNHEILAMLVKRIQEHLGNNYETEELLPMSQSTLAGHLSPIIEGTFSGRGNWSSIPTYRMLMSLIRKRPRDIVKLCTLAARQAKSDNKTVIGTSSFESIFEEYSQGRLQDTVNEYRTELPDTERLLLGMKPSRQERNKGKGYIYTTAELLAKIGNIQQSGEFKFHGGALQPTPRALQTFCTRSTLLQREKILGNILKGSTLRRTGTYRTSSLTSDMLGRFIQHTDGRSSRIA